MEDLSPLSVEERFSASSYLLSMADYQSQVTGQEMVGKDFAYLETFFSRDVQRGRWPARYWLVASVLQ
jgi:hypothetical protein